MKGLCATDGVEFLFEGDRRSVDRSVQAGFRGALVRSRRVGPLNCPFLGFQLVIT